MNTRKTIVIASILAVAGAAGCGGRPATGVLTAEERQQGIQNEKVAADEFYQREKARIEGDKSLTEKQRREQLETVEAGYRSTHRMLQDEKPKDGRQQ